MIEILHRYSRAVLYRSETAETVRDAMISAVAAGADLRGANLAGADLGGADLWGADLRGADLGGADLGGADLRDADLRGADLGGADLGGAYLRGADLRDADLGGAYLGLADLGDAYLGGAKIAAGEICSIVGTGRICGYEWIAYAMADGTLRLRYGCEEMSAAEWRDRGEEIARQHEPKRVDLMVRVVSALLMMIEVCRG